MKWIAFLMTAAAFSSAGAQDAPLPNTFRIFGSNEILVEDFAVSGDRVRSPFRFDGTFLTNRLDLNLGWTGEQLQRLTVRAEILGTNSDYIPQEGLVIATLALQYENGAAATPYRIEAGDVFADLSRRMLQRQIRGASVELQPQIGRGTHSVILLTGSGEPDWRDTFTGAEDLLFGGVSWAWVSESEKTMVVGNVSTESAFGLQRDAMIAGIFGKRVFRNGTELEGEFSRLRADDEAMSIYAQLGRALGAFQWRLRYEDNGERYQPLGAVGIMADRSIAEAQARWRISRRWSVRGRLQQIDQQNVEIDAASVTFDGQPLRRRPALRLEATADVNRIGLREYRNVSADLRDDTLSYRGSWRDSPEREAHEHEIVAGRSFSFGRLAAGLGYRDLGDSESWSPVIEAALRRGAHLVRLYYGVISQRFMTAAFEDLRYQNRRMVYTFTRANHHVSMELGQELREPERSLGTTSRRVAVRYRYAFDASL